MKNLSARKVNHHSTLKHNGSTSHNISTGLSGNLEEDVSTFKGKHNASIGLQHHQSKVMHGKNSKDTASQEFD
jgi:hypothetical protein